LTRGTAKRFDASKTERSAMHFTILTKDDVTYSNA